MAYTAPPYRTREANAMPPLALSDEQIDALVRAAAPLPPRLRKPFLEDVARALQGRELGDGVIHRVVVEVSGAIGTRRSHIPANTTDRPGLAELAYSDVS